MTAILAWFRKYILHCLAAMGILLGGTASVRILGYASGPEFTGVQQIVTASGNTVRSERAQALVTAATPATTVALPSMSIPVALTQGATGTVWMAATANCDWLD